MARQRLIELLLWYCFVYILVANANDKLVVVEYSEGFQNPFAKIVKV